MNDRSDDVLLPAAAEALLGAWPLNEPAEDEWERRAVAIDERARKAEPGSTEAVWLAAPLPADPDASGPRAAVAAVPAQPPAPASVPPPAPASVPPPAPSVRPRSLTDLAREVVAQERARDTSDIALESLEVARAARRSAPSLSDALAAAPNARPATPSVPPASQAQPLPPNVVPLPVAAQPPATSGRRGTGAFVGITLLGAAAAGLIVWRSRVPPASVVPEQPAVTAATVAQASPETAKPSGPTGVPIEQLGAPQPGSVAAGPKPAAPLASAAPAKSAGETRSDGEKVVLEDDAPLGSEKVAAKADPPAPSPADDPDESDGKRKPAEMPTDLPQQPSTGAVQAAVGAVMGGARACIAGHDEASRATVTFGSDGSVKSVSVSGPAGGTPAAACIQGALRKARVAPFAKDSYSVGFSIRPN
jgi:hypothetical protein